jgi:hypothetical protein
VTARFALASVWWRGEYASNADLTDIAIHHTQTLFLAANATEQDELNQLAVIYEYHYNVKGYGGIGYHGIAFPSGRAYLTAPLSRWGANVLGENDHIWGFAGVGDYTDSIPPVGVLHGLGELVAMADSAHG